MSNPMNEFDFTIISRTLSKTWISSGFEFDLARCALGMVEEQYEFTENPCEKELGDFVYYLVNTANLLEIELSSEVITNPNSTPSLMYVVGKIKKLIRGDDNFNKNDMRISLSNLAFYSHQQALAIGSTPQEVQRVNQLKLVDRLNRGVIRGSGDNR